VAGDPVHFDHTASADNRGLDTKAFQVLWNRNHPADTIAEDGAYGPQTEARLKQAPATGFAIGPSCTNNHALVADILSVDGPDRVAPATRAHYAIILKNSGQVDWPATTQLRIGGGTTQLHDDSWTSSTVVTSIGNAIAAGSQGTVDFDVLTPTVDVETPISETFILDDNGTKFGTINLALTVTAGPDPGSSSSDGGDTNDTAPDESGGCNTGGSAGWLGILLSASLLYRGRRSRDR
jgi:hypothetical protein